MRIIVVTVLLIFITLTGHSFFPADSLSSASSVDSTSAESVTVLDSNLIAEWGELSRHQSFLSGKYQPVVYDVQQYITPRGSSYVFILLLLMLVAITYVKIAFGNDLEELLQSLKNRNIAQQIFRTRSSDISFSSFLLNVNFIVMMSLIVRYILTSRFDVLSLEQFSTILFLIFLFTFFYLAKVVALKLIGLVFELKEESEEYIFNLFTICKTLGLTLIPLVFVLYAAPEIFFDFILWLIIFISTGFVLIFVWRGLSTAYKLMYRSLYHFFIYVCVVEISPIFLLFKLLTKTIL